MRGGIALVSCLIMKDRDGGFERLLVWRRAREVVRVVYRLSDSGRLRNDWPLRDQMRRAAISVVSNVAEGYERGRRGELRQFLGIAKGSCGELRAQLYIAKDVGYVDGEEFEDLLTRLMEVSRLLSRFRAAVIRQQEGDRPPTSRVTGRQTESATSTG